MLATDWLQLIDRRMVELRIREQAIELAFEGATLVLEATWELLDSNELKLESGEGGSLGRRTYLHRLVGAKAVAWRFATADTVALLFSSGHSLVAAKAGAEILI